MTLKLLYRNNLTYLTTLLVVINKCKSMYVVTNQVPVKVVATGSQKLLPVTDILPVSTAKP